jgi:hypothetical protein
LNSNQVLTKSNSMQLLLDICVQEGRMKIMKSVVEEINFKPSED